MFDKGQNSATFRWEKVKPAEDSVLYDKDDWMYRLFCKSVDNPLVKHDPVMVDKDKSAKDSNDYVDIVISGLAPNSSYECRVAVVLGNLTGPDSVKYFKTFGKSYPRPIITEAKITAESATAIKLTWRLPEDFKGLGSQYSYGIFYGLDQADLVSSGRRLKVNRGQGTSAKVSGLHACESYSFVVAIIDDRQGEGEIYGPPSQPFTEATKYSPGAPPKHLTARLDPSSNRISLSWEPSCEGVDPSIKYDIHIRDVKFDKETTITIMNAHGSTPTIRHDLTKSVRYGAEYEIYVQTSTANSAKSNTVWVKTVPMPMPEYITAHLNVNDSTHDIIWKKEENLPPYLQNQDAQKKLKFRLYLSQNANLTSPIQIITTNMTTYKLPIESLEPGKIYFMGVTMVDKGIRLYVM